jgi:hypothetical protein
LIRLFAGFLISHNFSFLVVVSAATSFDVAAGKPLCRFPAGEASPQSLQIFCGTRETFGFRGISKLFVLPD